MVDDLVRDVKPSNKKLADGTKDCPAASFSYHLPERIVNQHSIVVDRSGEVIAIYLDKVFSDELQVTGSIQKPGQS